MSKMTFENLSRVRQACAECTKCGLCKTKTNSVFSDGVENAKIMFVGEGPGRFEDEQGLPFVGPSGKLLDKYLEVIDLDRRKNVYITNIVKCRPPQNRDPSDEEALACIDFLRAQVRLIKPKIIVCLGRIAAQRLISPDFRVTRQHGEFYDKKGTLMMGTFHPSALLRNPAQKSLALEDFQALRDIIEDLKLDK